MLKILNKAHLSLLPVVALAAAVMTGHPAVAIAVDVENGKENFEEYCAACHGFDGIKQIPEAPSFAKGDTLDKPDAELAKSIRDGKGENMPAWDEDLNNDEIANVIAYVRTFHKAE